MTDYLATIVSIAVHRPGTNPIYGEGVTTVRIEDDAAGPFIVIEQDGNETTRNGKILLEIDELRAVLREAEKLMQQDGLRHD